MLQILSGRFFGTGQINQNEFDSVLYSNFSWFQPVSTVVGELRPADARGTSISSYVFRFTMRYERSPKDILVMPSGDEAAEQFRTLACLWFKAFFHPDRYHVEMLCRQEPRHASDGGVPSRFVDTFFDQRSMKSVQEIEGFVGFIEKAIRMPRRAYRLLISCASAFLDALEAIDTNRDLAYSMFVYSLEALTQASDDFVPTWDDFPQDARLCLNKQFAEMQPQHVNEIKAALLNNPHLKLKKRFIGFISAHVENSFFIDEAQGRTALPKNELDRALANLYDTRSGYVHSLQPIQQQLRLPNWGAKVDYFPWDHEPFLTFSGLSRLVRHVLIRFVERQPTLEKEDYPGWRSELPGIIEGRLAPEYWIARTDNLRKEQAVSRFNGFLSYLASHMHEVPLKLPDMRQLMGQIESLVPQCSPSDRRVWLCLYNLVNCIIREADRRPRWEEFLAKNERDANSCAIELLVSQTIFLNRFPWSVQECEHEFERYLKGKHRARAINLPRSVEVAIMSELANMYLAEGATENFRRWIDRAVLDAAGSYETQACLQECRAKSTSVSIAKILRIPESVLREPKRVADSTGNGDSCSLSYSQNNNATTRTAGPRPSDGDPNLNNWLTHVASYHEAAHAVAAYYFRFPCLYAELLPITNGCIGENAHFVQDLEAVKIALSYLQRKGLPSGKAITLQCAVLEMGRATNVQVNGMALDQALCNAQDDLDFRDEIFSLNGFSVQQQREINEASKLHCDQLIQTQEFGLAVDSVAELLRTKQNLSDHEIAQAVETVTQWRCRPMSGEPTNSSIELEAFYLHTRQIPGNDAIRDWLTSERGLRYGIYATP